MKKKLVIAALLGLLLTLIVCSATAATCTNHNWTEWKVKDGVSHSRSCQNDGCYATEYEDHYGGTATCVSKASCEVCGRAYGKATGVHVWEVSSYTDAQHTLTCYGCQRKQTASHNWTAWTVKDGVSHSRHCQDEGCFATEYEDHYGGTATCVSKASCEVCGRAYGSATGVHVWEYSSSTDVRHTMICHGCQRTQTDFHSGGTATCVEKRKCETCGQSYGSTNEQHAWNYNAGVVISEATCQKGRVTRISCYLCDATFDKTDLNKLDCVGEARVGKAATCTEDGYYVMVCKTCGEEKGLGDTIPALGHDLSAWQPIANNSNSHSRTCTRCSYTETDRHSLTERVIQEANCTTWGEIRTECSICGYSRTNVSEVNPDKHAPGKKMYTKESTCCIQGYTYHLCTRCNAETSITNIPLTGHDYRYFEYDGAANATTHNLHCNSGCCAYMPGYPYKTENHYGGTATCKSGALCAVCGYEYTEPLAHTMGNWYKKNETHDMRNCSKCDYYELAPHHYTATVSINSEQHSKKCTVCGVTVYSKHNLVTTVTQEASCETGTVTEITCTDCNLKETKVADDMKQHVYKIHTIKEPTCTEGGLIQTYCINCPKRFPDETTDPLGHTLLNDRVVAESTCSTPGILREYCTQKGCDYYEDTEIPIKPTWHDFGDWTYADDNSHTRTCKNGCGLVETAAHTGGTATCDKQATCTVCRSAYGELVPHEMSKWIYLSADKHAQTCMNCNYTVTKAHNYVETKIRPALCWAMGQKTEQCTDCLDLLYTHIPFDPDNHDVTEPYYYAPTCKQKGFTADKCTMCGELVNYAEIPQLEHTFGAWEYVSDDEHSRSCLTAGCDATQTEAHTSGELTCAGAQTCNLCGASKNHSMMQSTTIAPTCTKPGKVLMECANCDYYFYVAGASKLGHDWADEWEIGTTNDFHFRRCQRLGCHATEDGDHEMGETVLVPSTCTVCGEETTTCTVCGYYECDFLPKAEHDLSIIVAADNFHYLRCANEGCTYATTEEHTGGTADQDELYTCTKCGQKYDPNGKDTSSSNHVTDYSKKDIINTSLSSPRVIGTIYMGECFYEENEAWCYLNICKDGTLTDRDGQVVGKHKNDLLYDNDGSLIGVILSDKMVLGAAGDDFSVYLNEYYKQHPEAIPAE